MTYSYFNTHADTKTSTEITVTVMTSLQKSLLSSQFLPVSLSPKIEP